MVRVGSDERSFTVDSNWEKLPSGWEAPMAAVAVDSRDRVYGFNRGPNKVIIFDKEGNYLDHWKDSDFIFPHAIYADHADNIWIVDRDAGQVLKYTPEGELLLSIGEKGYRSDTGADNSVFTSDGFKDVTHAGEPFNLPAGVAVAPSGDVFVADGYANCRVHRFDSQGNHILSWGEPGNGEGQFMLPHGVSIASDGTVLVSDRENDRIQAFDQTGNFLSEWATDLIGPALVWQDSIGQGFVPEHNGGNFSVLSSEGGRIARWGGEQYISCHGAAGDSEGGIYFVQPVTGLIGRHIVKYIPE